LLRKSFSFGSEDRVILSISLLLQKDQPLELADHYLKPQQLFQELLVLSALPFYLSLRVVTFSLQRLDQTVQVQD